MNVVMKTEAFPTEQQDTYGDGHEAEDGYDTGNPPEENAENLILWNVLKRTDPRATKPFQRAGGFRGSSIDPVWRLQIMTEVFGPVGKGWGYEQIEWTIAERMFFSLCRVWYVDPMTGEKHFTGPQWGGTELIKRNRDGTERPDDESPKASITDAIGKCMLQIGLCADVYLGQFDDDKYRDESTTFYTVKENPNLRKPAIEKFEADLKEKLDAVTDLDALDDLWRNGTNARIREIGSVDKAAQHRMISAFSQKKNALINVILKTPEEPANPEKPAPDPVNPSPGTETAKAPKPSQKAPDGPAKAPEEPATMVTIPPPMIIDIPTTEDGKLDWKAWGAEAKRQLIQAGNGLYGADWVNDWLGNNSEHLAIMREHNAKWADAVSAKVTQVLDHYLVREEAAQEEARKEFPTIAVKPLEGSENPDWTRFVRDVRRYIRNSPDCFVAREWWSRHSFAVKNLSAADTINEKGTTGSAAAAALKTELVAKFPQLSKIVN